MEKLSKSVIGILIISLLIGIFATSCKKKKEYKNDYITESIPSSVLPDAIRENVAELIPIYFGTTPPDLTNKDFVSSPHVMFYNSNSSNPDSVVYHSDRYIAFRYSESNGLTYYSRQWDDVEQTDIYENVANINVTGSNNNFSYYYLTIGYPNGLYAEQSTIISGTLGDDGVYNFHVAVILLETSGNPNLEPVNSYRVLKDEDGFSQFENWLNSKSDVKPSQDISDETIFKLFRKN